MGKWSEYFKAHRKSRQHETVTVVCELFSAEEKEKSEELQFEDKAMKVLNIFRLLRGKKSLPTEIDRKTKDESMKVIPKNALDLGTGTGRDAFYLTSQGFRVTALDSEPEAGVVLREISINTGMPEPKFQLATFNNMVLNEQFDLINASLALPFTKPIDFKAVWSNVVQHIKDNGRFSGHFFGNHHSWSDKPDMTFFTIEACLKLFSDNFIIEFFKIEQEICSTVTEGRKFWHEFDIVAKKKPDRPEALLFSIAPIPLKARAAKNDIGYKNNDDKEPKYRGLASGFLNKKTT